jgi:aerobic-type carbon monoxide dehydrogenase small subunit (CoxS/CutS family)
MKIEIRTVINGRETETAVKPRSGNICRCGTYREVRAAIQSLSENVPTITAH